MFIVFLSWIAPLWSLLLVGCTEHKPFALQERSIKLNTASKVFSNPDDDANAQAKAFIDQRFIIVDGEAFTITPPHDYVTYTEAFELHAFHYEVVKQEPSIAETLNGVQWKGVVRISFSAHRHYLFGSSGSRGIDEWYEWIDATKPIDLLLRLKLGTWRIQSPEAPILLRAMTAPEAVTFKAKPMEDAG